MSAVINSICNIISFQILRVTSAVVLRFLAVSITATDLTKYILGTSVILHMSFLLQVVLVHPMKAYGGGIAPLVLNRHGMFHAPAAYGRGIRLPVLTA